MNRSELNKKGEEEEEEEGEHEAGEDEEDWRPLDLLCLAALRQHNLHEADYSSPLGSIFYRNIFING